MKRPAIRWHGGKWRLAPWIIEQMPPHTIYVEPFGGGGSVLLQKPRAKYDVYNDLDGQVVNLFRVLRDPEQTAELARLVYFTPFARAEFDATYGGPEPRTPVAQAHRMLIRSAMGFGSDGATRIAKTGFRGKIGANGSASMTWARWPMDIVEYTERLRGVVIEQRPAEKVISHFDSARTLFYVDPPYVHSTRTSMQRRARKNHGYRHEMSDADHVALLEQLRGVKGIVLLSGYASPLYDELLADWRRISTTSIVESSEIREEILWINRPAPAGITQGELQC